jgi:AcrR family transcriptional regulator
MNPAKRRPAAPADRYHHGNLRQALVDAGLAALETGGFGERGEISLRELARQVGVSANASYRHFVDKEALLVALATEGFRRFAAAQAKAAAATSTAKDAFRAAGRAYVAFARANPALFRLMFGRFASSHHEAELAETSRIAFDGLRAGVAAVLGLDLADAAVTTAAVRAWSLVHGLSNLILDGQIGDIAEDPDALVDAVLQHAVPAPAGVAKPG